MTREASVYETQRTPLLAAVEVGKSLIPREEENLSSSSSNVPEDSESRYTRVDERERERTAYWLHAHASAVIRAKRLDAKFQVSSATVEYLKIYPARFTLLSLSRDQLHNLHPRFATGV